MTDIDGAHRSALLRLHLSRLRKNHGKNGVLPCAGGEETGEKGERGRECTVPKHHMQWGEMGKRGGEGGENGRNERKPGRVVAHQGGHETHRFKFNRLFSDCDRQRLELVQRAVAGI